jgi:hypothetical protein
VVRFQQALPCQCAPALHGVHPVVNRIAIGGLQVLDGEAAIGQREHTQRVEYKVPW